jgi:hypothetical protein
MNSRKLSKRRLDRVLTGCVTTRPLPSYAMQDTDYLGFYTGRKLEGEEAPGQSVDGMCYNRAEDP